MPSKVRSPLAVRSTETVEAREASGVAAHPAGFLLLVDDECGIFAHVPGARRQPAGPLVPKDGVELAGCEGITVGADGHVVYVVSENSRRVIALPIALQRRAGAPPKLALGKSKRVGKLPRLGKKGNKGWEGLAMRSGRFAKDGRDRLVAVHEGKPRRVGFFAIEDLDRSVILDLPRSLDNVLADLSDIAVHPRRGTLFLLSDESAAIAEVEVRDGALHPLWAAPLPVSRKLKPEGIAFTPEGDLWLVTEKDRGLRRLELPSLQPAARRARNGATRPAARRPAVLAARGAARRRPAAARSPLSRA